MALISQRLFLFLYPKMGMFSNQAVCDIYVGKGAGKRMLQEIREAKHSVKILSPYLSAGLIQELIRLHKRGIEVSLITVEDLEDFQGEHYRNIYRLIRQEKVKSPRREKRQSRFKYLSWILLALTLVLLLLFLQDSFKSGEFELKSLWLVAVAFTFILSRAYHYRWKTGRTFDYHYTTLFPIRVFLTPEQMGLEHGTLVHAKIYLIDDRIAYLGSLNFTKSGTEDNYETRIRTEDPETVQKLVQEFARLMTESKLARRDIQKWGQRLYNEDK